MKRPREIKRDLTENQLIGVLEKDADAEDSLNGR
jgi:hypothetical protein